MSLELRLLPRDEWDRLNGTEMESIWPILPDDAQVIVIEDDGALVACWSLFRQLHCEGCYIAPAYRKRTTVARMLLRGLYQVARAMGARSIATAACSDDVKVMLRRMQAVELPGAHFSIPV